ncbi:MAG TPA: erythromycin esterase family protein [Thermoanaerobaculia bacterium]|nr:erythromycin esterase family protein [Thermoanaerobaculia bacterium]
MNIEALRGAMHAVNGDSTDYDALMDLIGNASIVCIGEASHGTHEFYRERAKITKRLIDEKGFQAVAVEADWPDAYRVNRYVRANTDDGSANEALSGFTARFPTWMWRNADVLDFVGWLRGFNDALADDSQKVGFYGVDLYSLFSSIEAVIQYLEQVDPEGAKHARSRYACFDHYGDEAQAYGYATAAGIAQSCQDAVVTQLTELRRRASELVAQSDLPADEFFYAEQNARLVANAEQYYRSMFAGRVSSWNLRDRHMAETIDALVAHLSKGRAPAKIVVWAHNSHLGDARFTEMGQQGELNVGQLVRERYQDDAVLIGFSTYTGTVTAADDWDAPAQQKRVRPALKGSYEELLHDVSPSPYYLTFRGGSLAAEELDHPRLQRAIGVIYRPDTERQSHYFHAQLPRQFDAMIHFDETRAVEPLEQTPQEHGAEPPETFPSGI